MFPRFVVSRIEGSIAFGTVTGTLHGSETWIADGWLGHLKSDSRFVYGRWHKLDEWWGFAPQDSSDVERLRRQSEWEVLDLYWGERAELVLDSSRRWVERQFDDLDHDHCAICTKTIGAGGQPLGFVSEEDDTWVCRECFDNFVRRRSLQFIPGS
jgi:hypothetical protein